MKAANTNAESERSKQGRGPQSIARQAQPAIPQPETKEAARPAVPPEVRLHTNRLTLENSTRHAVMRALMGESVIGGDNQDTYGERPGGTSKKHKKVPDMTTGKPKSPDRDNAQSALDRRNMLLSGASLLTLSVGRSQPSERARTKASPIRSPASEQPPANPIFSSSGAMTSALPTSAPTPMG